ncbi:MAG: hypothetical protein JNJ88_04840 [Planctomycetes bacterium]|nr:hypothetical protein [Planctomycetota bacterium]
MKFAKIAITLIVILGVAAYWGLRKSVDQPGAGELESKLVVPRVEDPGEQPMASQSSSPSVASAPSALSLHEKSDRLIRVVDPQRQPKAGAQAWLLPKAKRYVCAADAALLGESDANGELELVSTGPKSMLEKEAVVRADGYLSRIVTAELTRGGGHEIQLEEAKFIDFECVDTAGAPVDGAVVALSIDRVTREQNSFDDDLFIHSMPGADPRTAIFIGRSDSAGQIRIRNLPSQEMTLLAEKHGLAPIDKPTTVNPSNQEKVRIRFGAIYASIVRVEGDEVFGGAMQGSQALSFANSSAAEQGRAFNQLRAQYPDALILVAVPADGQPFTVRNRILLRSAGFLEHESTAHKLSNPPIVEIVRPSTTVAGALRSVEASVYVKDAAGSTIPSFAPWHITYSSSGGSTSKRDRSEELSVQIPFGTPTRLPMGWYHVESFSSVLSAHLDTRDFEIREGIGPRIDITIRGTWAPCRIRVVDEASGSSLGKCTVGVGAESGPSDLVTLESGVREMWLPSGKCNIKLVDATYSATQTLFEVLPISDRSKPQDILVMARRQK